MVFPIDPSLKAAILRQYDNNLSRYPVIRAEADTFLRDKEEDLSLCLQYLYGHMAAQDVLSIAVTDLAGYVSATLEAYKQIRYLKTVPPEIFFPYVLYHRVNSERADASRGFLLKELLPLVQEKTMEQAALAVNYWCYAHATYTPADDRTLGPMAVLNRTLGRCGEESVLAVAALRSVGIPARQCYCPRWSHCDDNHAWVEVWIDGTWHYLGACEPEPVLDRGWFTAAASRAMLVDTKDWSGDALYQTVNCTSRYTGSRGLTVQVTENDTPVSGARVRFQIVNYSELYTLWQTDTDENGLARFETGPGDLMVYVRYGNKVHLEKVDLRQQTALKVELRDTGFPEQLLTDLVPPADTSGAVPFAENSRHRQLLARCEAHLAARRAEFAEKAGYLRQAARNHGEIAAFLEDPRYLPSHKAELLDTLRPKDFVDISRETLADALEAAEPSRGCWPADIFRQYILAPRITDEMLLPERQQIRTLFPGGFVDPAEILAWMQTYMQILPDEGVSSHYPSAFGCLRCRQVPAFAFNMVFVALCRAFRFPARLEPHTGDGQWLDKDGAWHGIDPAEEPVNLTLTLPVGKKLNYFEHFTVGRWNGEDFQSLQYPGLTVENRHVFRLQPGLYRIAATTRQIDGTASVSLRHVFLTEDCTLPLTLPEDQTEKRLTQVPLTLPEGPVKKWAAENAGQDQLLIFADPGSEPTEHLLREMQECGNEFRQLSCRILIVTENGEHPTLKALISQLPNGKLLRGQDEAALAALHRQMQLGDLRLPFAVCVDKGGRGVYADANYRIRMARTLLEVQTLLESSLIEQPVAKHTESLYE